MLPFPTGCLGEIWACIVSVFEKFSTYFSNLFFLIVDQSFLLTAYFTNFASCFYFYVLPKTEDR